MQASSGRTRQGLQDRAALLQREGLRRAVADYGEAIKLSPKDAWPLRTGARLREKEDHDAAIADCTEAIKIDPKYGWAYNNRGVAYYGLHEYDAALADHAEAIRSIPGTCGPIPATAWHGRKG